MSGICGVVRFDGAPVRREEIAAHTAFLDFRGPDAQGVWSRDGAGLGHAMLRTTFESAAEAQPATLDGETWITADARVDARSDLVAKLEARGRAQLAKANDAELILHAWDVWGESLLDHLLGDFAFAIWDAPRKRLFCARDPFGVKAFFYARPGRSIVFSNTLDSVRRHAGVSGDLDDYAIADFLMFEMSQDPSATAFRDIRRLPPGHCLTASRDSFEVREYWRLPLGAEVRFRAANDYVERFKELLAAAVTDRLRTDRVGIELSGGLDSTAIAATALSAPGRTASLTVIAQTVVYDRLIPDEERRYAGMAAGRLGIPIHYFVADDYPLYARCDRPENRWPEPSHDPGAAATFDSFRQMASLTRVALTGWDGDALFNESPKPYFRKLLREGRIVRLLAGMARYGVSQRRLVPLTLRQWLRPARGGAARAAYPAWLDPGLEKRLDLRARWQAAHDEPEVSHPVRPYAFRTLAYIRRVSSFFEYYDAGTTRLPLEYRHPLMDLRLQEYCLSLPPLPWCVKKHIVREAMRGVLPEAVRRRPKTPLPGSPELELARQPGSQWIDRFVPAPQLERFVDRSRIPAVRAGGDREACWRDLRPLSLSFWLQGI